MMMNESKNGAQIVSSPGTILADDKPTEPDEPHELAVHQDGGQGKHFKNRSSSQKDGKRMLK